MSELEQKSNELTMSLEEANKAVDQQNERIHELERKLIEAEKQNAAITKRGTQVVSENTQLKASPEIAAQIARLEYDLKVAEQFVRSGAFPKMTPEKCYTIMKAGEEMGMKPIESLNAFYIVNGSINPYGMHMIARITQEGYKIEYFDETTSSVSVKVTKGDFEAIETADASEQVLQKSNAMKFAKQNKMRFHAIRKIITFHLPHLFSSVTDIFTAEYREHKGEAMTLSEKDNAEEKKRVSDWIEEAETVEDLEQVKEDAKQFELFPEYEEKEHKIKNQ